MGNEFQCIGRIRSVFIEAFIFVLAYPEGCSFSTDSYRGVDKLIPVDVYLPGCLPKQEEVIDAITKLRKKVSREIYEEGPNRKFDVLLPIKTIMLDAVLILEITIKDDSINRHLLQRYLLKHFSNTRVQSLPTN
ncbi:hypothetical protein SLA2020_430420 [Shorea laevis]